MFIRPPPSSSLSLASLLTRYIYPDRCIKQSDFFSTRGLCLESKRSRNTERKGEHYRLPIVISRHPHARRAADKAMAWLPEIWGGGSATPPSISSLLGEGVGELTAMRMFR